MTKRKKTKSDATTKHFVSRSMFEMIARLLKCCFIFVISPHLRADSHNDLPWNIRKFAGGKLNTLGALETGLQHQDPWSKSSWSHTDLPRLREGRVGAQVTFVR